MRVIFSSELTFGEINEHEVTDVAGKASEVAEFLERAGVIGPRTPESIVLKLDAVEALAQFEAATASALAGEAAEKPAESGNRVLRFCNKIQGNEGHPLPKYKVSSTARQGCKWFNNVVAGDVLDLVRAEKPEDLGEVFGRAVVVAKEYITLDDVLANADHSHITYSDPISCARFGADTAVLNALKVAYGDDIHSRDKFTVLHLLRIND